MNLLKEYFTSIFCCLFSVSLCSQISQETLPIHQDYLSDNIFLVHPAAAGIGEHGKIRAAIRMEGFGVANSPQIQTVNMHGTFSESSQAAFGILLLNNGSNSTFNQQALRLTYAYHLPLDEEQRFEQLSFGLSMSGIQSIVGQNSFNDPNIPAVTQPSFQLNADFGASYHLNGLSGYFTVKNVRLSGENNFFSIDNEFNPRSYVFGLAYFFGDEEKFQFEPSFLVQVKDEVGERVLDLNVKIYKMFTNAQLWAALSYRRSFLDIDTTVGTQYISPIFGMNFKKMMFAYTYSNQMGQITPTIGAFHQITVGINILYRDPKLFANPNINGAVF